MRVMASSRPLERTALQRLRTLCGRFLVSGTSAEVIAARRTQDPYTRE
jgi:hypothetical protein